MNPQQRDWLLSVAKRIPELFKGIEDGNMISRIVIGERVIEGNIVQLILVAEVVDSGRNPLASHASTNYPETP